MTATAQLLRFQVPILDSSMPLTHLMLEASGILADELSRHGLCARTQPLWEVKHARQVLATEIKVAPMPKESDLTGALKLTEVKCPACSFEFEVF